MAFLFLRRTTAPLIHEWGPRARCDGVSATPSFRAGRESATLRQTLRHLLTRFVAGPPPTWDDVAGSPGSRRAFRGCWLMQRPVPGGCSGAVPCLDPGPPSADATALPTRRRTAGRPPGTGAAPRRGGRRPRGDAFSLGAPARCVRPRTDGAAPRPWVPRGAAVRSNVPRRRGTVSGPRAASSSGRAGDFSSQGAGFEPRAAHRPGQSAIGILVSAPRGTPMTGRTPRRTSTEVRGPGPDGAASRAGGPAGGGRSTRLITPRRVPASVRAP